MNTSLFTYEFPPELVAQHPLPERDHAKMMVVHRKTQSWEHQHFYNLPDYLKPGDLLILNDAEADLVSYEGKQVPALPPYIKRKQIDDFSKEDYERYRTIYAKTPGSKAAPTAGFHFTQELLQKLQTEGVEIQTLTLHVSFDTFKPIRSEKIQDHPMHGENYFLPPATEEAICKAKEESRRIIAVGTTTVRALESWALSPTKNQTSLFITPGFQFQIVDALITNFHRPRSTVLVMVATFAGHELIGAAYQEAIQKKYRLFSYGDCLLII